MFGENCFLCLESIGDSIDQIAVDSAECQAVNLQQLLEKHFEQELNGTLSWTTTSVLCCKCWTAISIFHEFCLRVQRAHAELANTLPPPKDLITEDNVEKEVVHRSAEQPPTEDNVETEVVHRSADSPPKRWRGRPRKAASQLNKRLHEELAADIQIAEPKTENANLNPSIYDEKHETLQEDLIDAGGSAESCEAQYVVELVASPEHTQNSDTCSDLIESDCSDDLLVPLEYHTQNSQSDLNKKEEEWTNQRLDEYISTHIKLSCCLCGCSFNRFFDLRDHFQAQHQTNGYVRCCGKKLINRSFLVDHLRMHENPEYFKCSHCGKILADRVNLKNHLKQIHESGRIFRCKICSKSFTRRSVLRLHASIHIPIDQRKFACSQCDKTFALQILLNRHMKSTHQNKNKFSRICETCGIPLHSYDFMQRHMDEHAGVNRTVQCKKCGATLVNKYALTSHMKRMHTRPIPQTCSICSKVSPSESAHKAHVYLKHTSKPKHSCPICKKTFRNLIHSKEHRATHTGEDLHTCTFCQKTFRFYSSMHRHQKNFHLKEWTESRLQRGLVVRRVDMEKYEKIMAELVES